MQPALRHLLAAAVLLLAATSVAWTKDGRNPERGPPGRDMQSRGQERSQERGPRRRDDGMSDSVRSVERTHRGEVLHAERVQSDGREVNRIKMLDDRGRIRVFMDDPQQRRREPPTRDDDN